MSPAIKSWGRHSLRLDASGVLASNTSASAALHSSNQFSLRRLISGNKRQFRFVESTKLSSLAGPPVFEDHEFFLHVVPLPSRYSSNL